MKMNLHKYGFLPTAVIFYTLFTILAMVFSGSVRAATISVDDNAPNDPGSGNPTVSDPLENGSAEHPYDAIQEAMDSANNTDVIEVQPGLYYERVNFPANKYILLRSTQPDDWGVVKNTVIDAQKLGRGITITGIGSCRLEGLTVTGGLVAKGEAGGGIYGKENYGYIRRCIIEGNEVWEGPGYGGGIAAFYGKISECIIQNNISSESGGGAFDVRSMDRCIVRNNGSRRGGGLTCARGPITNCVIVQNTADISGGAIEYFSGDMVHCTVADNLTGLGEGGAIVSRADAAITNSILWGNDDPIRLQDGAVVDVRYSCLQGTIPYPGTDNIKTDPLFLDAGGGDYHLSFGSDCIDRALSIADVTTDVEGLYRPIDGDGDRIAKSDMGAYEYMIPGDKTILGISKDSYAFECLLDGSVPQAQILTIQNLGLVEMDWTTETDCSWIGIDETPVPLAALSSREVHLRVNPTGLAWGTYTGNLIVSSQQAINGSRTVTVTLKITGPKIQLSSNALLFRGPQGLSNPKTKSIVVTNIGGGQLNWSTDPTGSNTWLRIDPVQGNVTAGASESIIIGVNTAGLVAGTYTCSATISAAGSEIAEQTLSVTLDIYLSGYGGGSGVEEDPFQIWTAEQLLELGQHTIDYDKYFILMGDLDLTGKTSFQAFIAKDTSVSQAGFQGTGFSGCLDGNGHTIRKMTISYDRAGTKYRYLGLFGQIDSAGVVKNLSLDEMSISPSAQVSHIGGIAGNCLGRIENCRVSGTVSYLMMPSGGLTNGNSYVGGIAGNVEGGQVLHCEFSGPVWGSSYVGGIAGRNTGTIGYCQTNGTIQGRNIIGGLIGWSNGTIRDSTSRGMISGENALGGLIGQQEQGSVSRCLSSVSILMGGKDIYYQGLYVGGLIGHCLSSQVEDCSATGTIGLTTQMANVAGGLIGRSTRSNLSRCDAMGSVVSQGGAIGGLVGEVFEGGALQSCFAQGSVTGTEYLGGLVGRAIKKDDLYIRNCYAIGSVKGSIRCGGLVGSFSGTGIEKSYSAGIVQANSNGGGLVGQLVAGNVSNCFWDVDSSGIGTSAAGTGKTTAEMKTPATFTDAGWDFVGETVNGTEDIWRLCLEGIDYPGLATIAASHGDYACPEGVRIDDLMVLAERWMVTTPGETGLSDGNRDEVVNLSDFGILSDNWLMDPLALSLVARWTMDGDFSDSAGGYTGTAVGDPVFVGQDQARMGSGALELDDNDEVVISGFQSIPGPAPRTCTAWIKIQPVSFLSGRILEWGTSKTSGGLWRIGISEGLLSLDVGGGYLRGRTHVDTGQWVHVAVVLPAGKQSNSDVLLYINGCQDPIQLQGQTTNINTGFETVVRIGFVPSVTYAPFIGMIDDVRIYNRGLSAEEIAGLAASTGVFAGMNQLVNLHHGNRGILKGQFPGDWIGTSVNWEQISGPEVVVIADPMALTTSADFATEGKYGFRLTATDGIVTASDEVAITVTNGLVRYWPFDGDLLDFLGSPAVPMENPTIVGPPKARVGSGALRLSNYCWIDVPDFKGITGTHARTCMAWVWIEPAGGPTLSILNWGDMNVAGGSWNVQINSFGKLQVQISGGGSMATVSSVNYFEWNHVAAVLPEGGDSAEDLRLYFNGVQETGTIKAGAIYTVAKSGMRIGADGTVNFFTGRIDDLRVYDRELTVEEIVAAMGP